MPPIATATLTIKDGILRVVTPAPPREQRRPIDTFLAALAEDRGDRAVAIVLSGVGSDGAQGVRMIKEHGGATLAQAEFDHVVQGGMPQSAADTGMVDHVVPVEDMPNLLIDYQQHLGVVAERKDGNGTRTDAMHLAPPRVMSSGSCDLACARDRKRLVERGGRRVIQDIRTANLVAGKSTA